MDRTFNVLFLCTGNSARSIMAEVIMNNHSHGRFMAYSAGSHPAGQVHPEVLSQIKLAGLPTGSLRSKSWDEFSLPESPHMDFVFTVCDRFAGENCPIWPGRPITAHWGIPDPVEVVGDTYIRQKAMNQAFHQLARRIDLFSILPVEKLDRMALQSELDVIGQIQDVVE